MRSPDLVDRYLPAEFAARLPPADRKWRGRTVLLLWALGYPLDMAWCLGMAEEPEQCAYYQLAMAELDDQRLVAQLEATVTSRADGHALAFGRIGSIEVLIRP
jgi:hypothetical protein